MKLFKTISDLQQLQKTDPAYRIVNTCLTRTGHLEGYFVLIEEGDREFELPELSGNIATLSFDGVFKAHGYYHAVYLLNNSFGIEFVIPDASWLDADTKANLDINTI